MSVLVFYFRKKIACISEFFSWRKIANFLSLVCFSAISWGLSSSAFVFALKSPYDGISLSKIYSSSFFVSFISSLPFSVSGWGLREFSAVQTFPIIGIPSEKAFSASIVIGFISILSIVFYFLIIKNILKKDFFIKFKNKLSKKDEIYFDNKMSEKTDRLEKKLTKVLAYATSILLFFQFYIPSRNITLSVNLADPLACCGLLLFSYKYVFLKKNFPKPLFSLSLFFSAVFLIFLCAFLNGVYHFGFTQWAISKMVGLFILFGYAAVPFLFVQEASEKECQRLIKVMAVALSSLILFLLIKKYAFSLFSITVQEVEKNIFSGYACNRNAFSIQILFLIIGLSSFRKNQSLLIAFLYAILILTFSRSGHLVGLYVFFLLCMKKSWRYGADIFIKCALFIGGLFLCEQLLSYILKIFSHLPPYSCFQNSYSTDSSDHERWYTMKEAWYLFLKKPWIGNGLGAFVGKEFLENKRLLVIHNTPLWFLAELGILGVLGFLFFLKRAIAFFLRETLCPHNKFFDFFFLNFLIIFFMMSIVHEVFYQRILWFALGITLTRVTALQSQKSLSKSAIKLIS